MDTRKKLLIYAHYYVPDVASTGQILTELAEGLQESFHITVICTVPSYTGKVSQYYRKHKYYYENMNGVDSGEMNQEDLTEDGMQQNESNADGSEEVIGGTEDAQ